MIWLVSYDDAKWQINDDVIDPSALIRMIEKASAIVYGEIRPEYPASWEIAGSSPVEYEIPPVVQQVTMAVLAELHNSRESSVVNPLSKAMIGLLTPYRDPTVA